MKVMLTGLQNRMRGTMGLPAKVGFVGTVVCLAGVVVGWGILPSFIKNKIAQIKNLAPGSEGRKMWEKTPFPLTFKIHVFNVTNVDAVQKGDVPMLHEMGPYYFDEYKEKVGLYDDEETDSISFYMKNTFVFNKEKSAPLTGDEIVNVPHVALLAMALTLERDQPAFVGVIGGTFDSLFNKPKNVFLRTTVMDLLFDGIVINCTNRKFPMKLVCSMLRKTDAYIESKPGIFLFSLFGKTNGTKEPGEYRVNRGTKDVSKVGQMITYKGKEVQDVWAGPACNSINGTDSTIFPPFLDCKPIPIFSSGLCRSLVSKCQGLSTYKGIPTLHFSSNLGDMSSNPKEKCFCPAPSKCLKKGVMDLKKCAGAPLISSLPHFYDADKSYEEAVRGLNPDESKHTIRLDIEALTGTPLRARLVLQFSIPIHSIPKIKITRGLPNLVLPFIWFDEGIELSDMILAEIDSKLFSLLRGIDIGKWVTTVAGAGVAVVGAGLHFLKPLRGKMATPAVNSFRPDEVLTIPSIT